MCSGIAHFSLHFRAYTTSIQPPYKCMQQHDIVEKVQRALRLRTPEHFQELLAGDDATTTKFPKAPGE